MPPRSSFHLGREHYYSALFHELAHSTGHENRLKRFKGEVDEMLFGSTSYSKEELVAEMASSFILNELGIETVDTERNSNAYLAGWLSKLKSDPHFIVEAAPKAAKAANYIFGRIE
ncbi:MAG: hypothetical protein CVV52_03675, partial [Spirochaetae bacterium HGW-Spirochaetae-8]